MLTLVKLEERDGMPQDARSIPFTVRENREHFVELLERVGQPLTSLSFTLVPLKSVSKSLHRLESITITTIRVNSG